MFDDIVDILGACPVIAAVHDDRFYEALESPAEVIFHLGISLIDAKERIDKAHSAKKKIFIHIDLAEGIGKDKAGVEYLATLGADGIISTRASLIRAAKDCGMFTVQRFFALDSQGVEGIGEMLESSYSDFIEIMPGVIGKIIERFASGKKPVIAGGLIETKSDVTDALSHGAVAVSTGKKALWYS